MSGTKNLLIMGGAMLALKRIDQEDPDVLMYARMIFAGYVVVSLIINVALHFRVIAARDLTMITIPPPTKSPFAAPTAPVPTTGSESRRSRVDANSDQERSTVLAYDMGLLQTARKSWLINVVILTLVHMKMSSVSPLLMSSIMGLVRYIDDPLFKLHILGYRSVGALKRPFAEEANPLGGLLKGIMPKLPSMEPESSEAASAIDSDSARGSQRFSPVEVEELHEDEDDDDDDDDDHEPGPLAEQDDPHDNDFESDGPDHEPKKSK
jgi:hypothetical protein